MPIELIVVYDGFLAAGFFWFLVCKWPRNPKPTIEWTPEDVSDWMTTLHLSKEYLFFSTQ